MNVEDFKKWFEGFCEAVGDDDYPVESQWNTLKAKIGELSQEKIVETVVVPKVEITPSIPPFTWPQRIGTPIPGTDKYYPPYQPNEVWCQHTGENGNLQN